MKLSELIEGVRAERPDEWTMDILSRKARGLEDALADARSGMRYIRESHGDLYGVAFDRVEEKASKALDGDVGGVVVGDVCWPDWGEEK